MTAILNFFILALTVSDYALCESQDTTSPAPVTITGDEMQYDTNTNTADVINNARAERVLDNKKVEVLTAKHFEVKFLAQDQSKDQPSKEEQNVEIIKAFGNVEFKSGEQTLTADCCTYNVPKEIIDCYGNVFIKDKNNKLKGDRGEIDLKTHKYTVKKEKNLVHAMIVSNKSPKRDKA